MSTVSISHATIEDLAAINRVVESAMMTWQLPERVKRLSLPSYKYSEIDFDHLKFVAASNNLKRIIAVAAWEKADSKETPSGYTALLLHGIYVDPEFHRQGIGRQLFKSAEQAVIDQGYDGLLVKAQEDAIEFFKSQGMVRLEAEIPEQQYADRFWKLITRS